MNTFMVVPHLLVAVILHEVAHGVAANYLGDDTAARMGRISLNPLRHIDPFMTIILPTLLILSGSPVVLGGAKPIPVQFHRLRHPRRDSALVAFAGPLTNFILVGIFTVLFHSLKSAEGSDYMNLALEFLIVGVAINLGLALFNLTPIPPLDGGRIVRAALPGKIGNLYARLEPFGLFILIGLMYAGLVTKWMIPVFTWFIGLLGLN